MRRGTGGPRALGWRHVATTSALLSLLVLGFPVVAHATTVTVDPSNMGDWQINTESPSGNSFAQFVTGPGTPPAGLGSLRYRVQEGGERVRLQTAAYNGLEIDDIVELSYSTWVSENNSGQAPMIQLFLDTSGDGLHDDTIVFEPTYQATWGPPGLNPALALNTWQTWNAADGVWWSTSGTPGPPDIFPLSDRAGARLAILHPAALRIGVGESGGSFNPFDGNADAITINGTTYDLEASASLVDCDATSDDMAAIQASVDGAPDGATIQLRGTCDFRTAAAHGGDTASVEAAAVVIRTTSPVDGLIIEGEPVPGGPPGRPTPSRTLLQGSGTQAAFFVAPGNTGVTIRNLTFDNFGRAVVAVNATGLTVGASEFGSTPEPHGNRILGRAGQSSAILLLANDRGFGDSAGTITMNYGAGGENTATIPVPAPRLLSGVTAAGNYITFDPPGAPDGTTRDVVGIDVRQRNSGSVEGVSIHNNAVGFFTNVFPSFNMNAVRVLAHSPGSTPRVRDVVVRDNNLGRLDELAESPATEFNAAGRAAIVLGRVGDYEVSGNTIRALISSTLIPNPGGGIVAGDSPNGRIVDNHVIVIATPGTSSSDLGGIGVLDGLFVLFGSDPNPPAVERVLVAHNTVGRPGSVTPETSRGIVLTDAAHVTVAHNTVASSTRPGVIIGAMLEGPGSVSDPGPVTVQGPVRRSVVCRNILAGHEDNFNEIEFVGASGSTSNALPFGSSFPGNLECRPTVTATPSFLAPGDGLTLTGSAWPARPVEATVSGDGGAAPITNTAMASASGSYSISFTDAELAAFDDGRLAVTVRSRDDLDPSIVSRSTGVNVDKGVITGGPYTRAAPHQVTQPDILGFGQATAQVEANHNNGFVSSSADASSTAPVGINVFGVSIGASLAQSDARIIHEIEIEDPGEYVVTVTIAGIQAQATADGSYNLPYVQGAYSQAFAAMEGGFLCRAEDRDPDEPSATPGECPSVDTSQFTSDFRYLACAPAIPELCKFTDSVQLTGTITIDELGTPGSGGAAVENLIVISGRVTAYAQVNGNGNAEAIVSGIITSMTAVPV